MAKVWQHPYVNVFKHLKVEEWKRSTKEGDVTALMDKALKGTVYRISGAVPASNYLQLPKTSTQSLGLTGHYLYILFKPAPAKYFVVHLDVATEDNQVVRISFSNLFKEFKSTATWLQFPFICGAAKGSVYESTAKMSKRDLVGLAPSHVRWTCLALNLRYILSLYLNRKYSHLKSVKLCANLLVKNIFTSDLLFDPGVTFPEAQQSRPASHGISPMPREMAFPVPKGESWHDLYDYIRFPSDGSKMPFDSIQKGTSNPPAFASTEDGPAGQLTKQRPLSKPVRDRVSLVQQITSPKEMARQSPLLAKSIPKIPRTASEPLPTARLVDRACRREGPQARGDSCIPVAPADDGGIHVYAHRNGEVTIHAVRVESDEVRSGLGRHGCNLLGPLLLHHCFRLLPDPILQLKKVIGFGGCSTKWALWAANGSVVVYPCHALIIAIALDSGRQRFFAGHTDKVAALAFNGNNTLLASAQMGPLSVMRVWDFPSGECLGMFKTGMHSVSCLSFSYSGGILCGTGKDRHGKTVVVVWNTVQVTRGGEAVMLAKAHTDVDIQTLKIAFFDDTRMVSCGRDNVRLWRVRSGALRSCPVNLGEYRALEFTDLDFEAGHSTDREPEDRTLFVCSRSGHVLEIDYKAVAVRNARRLLPPETRHGHRREKQTFHSGPGIALNGICLSPSFCATASEDGYLRLWPLDFSEVFLEAGAPDNLKVLCTTATGNVGCLDIQSKDYCTIMRSHMDSVLGFSVDGSQKQLVTVSQDNTIRVWNMESMQQAMGKAFYSLLYEFSASEETPVAVAFQPSQPVLACGFETGVVRTISLAASRLLEEHKLVSGSNTKRVQLWSVAAVQELRVKGSGARSSSVLLEQEMTLDGTVVSAAFEDSADMGIVGTTAGTLWYINWTDNTSIRLISGHKNKVNEVVFSPQESHCATCGEDGSVRVWALASLELVVQFQSCLCLAWSPATPSVSGGESQRIVAGYSDGTIRMFSLSRTEMELKMHPHAVAVTALGFSADGEIILSGGKDGLVAVSSPRTGMTIRVLTDHRSSPINVIHCTRKQRAELGIEGSDLWLAASADRRVSIWVSDWMKDRCELIDWLSFPAPTGPEVPNPLPPSLAAFCPWDTTTVAYVGFGLQKEILFYSLQQKQVIEKIPLPYFATSLSLSPAAARIAVGFRERVLRLVDRTAGTEQDYRGHDDVVGLCRFTPSGKRLFTASYNEILIWEVQSR
ncbi:hypothetical protein JRQ81_010082 [Phrynocephalus forsythii]|uniref:WD repeat-containing protein 90 n=1 Tax=Phrynocephalus forsythii TaxID=171643 RepID=A0A9Q0X7V3_9SAUR|nr:hypothetical protein JRQ81_010082 [Phrynocephalus forsythii]